MRSSFKLGLMAFILGAFLAPSLSTAADESLKMKWGVYQQTTEKYKITLPATWEVRENLTLGRYKVSLMAISPLKPNNGFRENVNVVSEDAVPSFDLKRYVTANIAAMSKAVNKFKVLAQGEVKHAQTPCQYLMYSHVSDQYDGVLKAIIFSYLDAKGRAYSITCTSTEKSFKDWLVTFMRIGQSFTLPPQ